MGRREYVDFDVEIARLSGGFTASVRPGGSASSPFVLPFEPTELAQFMVAVGPPREASRRLVPAATRLPEVKEYGRRLGDALFSGAVGEAFQSTLASARRRHRDVRIRLALAGVPELEPIPWEYMYTASLRRFLTLSAKTPLVRLFDVVDTSPPVSVVGPLRVLVMISSPNGTPALAVEKEEQLLRATTGDLVDAGELDLVVEHDATLRALQRALLEEFHVFHFIGHGGFDEDAQEGVLVLEREDGSAHRVSGERLGTLMHDAQGMQLAVLNACEGARSSGRDAFSGVGQALMRSGLPAVVAMHTEISDRAALVFSHEFYYYLTRGLGIDTAMAEARKAMAVSDEASEWGTAVLMRSGTEQPFSFPTVKTTGPDRSGRWASLYTAAQRAIAGNMPATAVPLLEQIAAERPDYADVAELLARIQAAPAGSPSATPPSAQSAPTQTLPSEVSGAATVDHSGNASEFPSPGSASDEIADVAEFAPKGHQTATRRRGVAVLTSAVLLTSLFALGASRPELLPWNTSSPPSSTPTTSTAAATIDVVRAGALIGMDVPIAGRASNQIVLPYAFSGQLHLGGIAEPTQGTQPLRVGDEVVRDVLMLRPDDTGRPVLVSTITKDHEVHDVLKAPNGKTIVDLGNSGLQAVANEDGSQFAYFGVTGDKEQDGNFGPDDFGIVVRDSNGQRSSELLLGLPDPSPEVVGFVDDAVFYRMNGSTWRWQPASGQNSLWSHDAMVAFDYAKRTGVGMTPAGCIGVLDVGLASQKTVQLDCHGAELIGISETGSYGIARSRGRHDRLILVPTASGRDTLEFRLPQNASFEGASVDSMTDAVVFDIRNQEGDRLVSCRFDGVCDVLTETQHPPGGLTGPPAYIVARRWGR